MKVRPSTFAGIKDVANALGISLGTVDRALHDRPGVSEKTKDRVRKMAEKLNYRPNVAARNLKLNRRLRVGVFLPEQIASFFDRVREGIRAGARAEGGVGVDLVFHSYPRLGEGASNAIEKSDWKHFDGLIMTPVNPAEIGTIYQKLERQNKAVIFVATDAPRTPRLASVAIDATISGGIAAELLGHVIHSPAAVATITGDLLIQDHAEKLRGFAGSLATLSPHLTLLPAIESHDVPSEAFRAAASLIKKHPHLGGLYINTANSLPVLRALEENGRLGKIRVITTDLYPELVPHIEVGDVLASLYQRPYAQGKAAFEMMIGFLTTGAAPKQIIRLAPHIILRSNLSLFTDPFSSGDSNNLSI
jgi:LacI family transcriptional regulator